MTLFTKWNVYLAFLWLILAAGTTYLIIGWFILQAQVRENPASGLALIGAVRWGFYLILFTGFIGINHYVRRNIHKNRQASSRFLICSWTTVMILVVFGVSAMAIQYVTRSNYEKNVEPALERCYQDYLSGLRDTPYQGCIE